MPAFFHMSNPLWSTQAQAWSMQQFLNAYTLHDSAFEEVQIVPHWGILVLITWDLQWNNVIPSQYRFLNIYFPKPYWSHWSQGAWYQSTLADMIAQPVSSAEREVMIQDGTIDLRAFQNGQDDIPPAPFDDTLTRTRFEFMNWSTLEIVHHQEVKFVCFDEQAQSFMLPM